MTTQYVALARVSSREQEREGFSLQVQEEALKRYAREHDGEIAKLFRIAETATKPEERRAFKDLLAFARKNAHWLSGILFFKVDRATFDRAQALLGHQTYQAHELVYAGELITCGHCGSPITGELKTKTTRTGRKQYRYYRCSKYNTKGHPRVRVRERDLDQQILGLFARIRIQDDKVRDWFGRVLRARSQDDQRSAQAEMAELNRQAANLRSQRDQLFEPPAP